MQSLLPRPLILALLVLSLCAGLVRFTPPDLTPRLLGRVWGALPPYTLLVRGGDTCLRCPVTVGSEPGTGVRLDAPLDITLRPTQPVFGPVFVHAFVHHAGHTGSWPVVLEHTADGTLLLGGIVRDLLELPPSARGRYELIFIVQRSPLPPSAAAVQARLAGTTTSADSQVLRSEVEVIAPLSP